MYIKQKIKPEKKKPKKKTALTVSSIHFLVILLLFSFFYLKGCSKHKQPNSIKVSIVSPAKTKPETKQARKKSTTKRKTVKKKPAKAPTKKTVKKKNKLLSPDQIIKSNETIVSEPQKIVPEINASEITHNLRKNLNKMKLNNSYRTDKSLMDYYDQVSQFLYSRWEQPPRAVANNGVQVVKVIISVDSNGNIKNSYIIDRCGISAIDSSIESLLSTLITLPKPPHGSEKIEIDMVTTPYEF